MDRKTARAVASLVVLLVVLGVSLYRTARQAPPRAPTSGVDPSAHLALGNPSGATPDPANPNNYLMRKPYFALSYNDAHGTANWVSWRLHRDDLGPAPRAEFFPDPELPRGFRRATPGDYTSSGFDRGHLCPRSDRGHAPEAAAATFVMTNIVPQSPNMNQKAWNDLEEYCRSLVRARRQYTLYVVAGPHGRGGEGTKGPAASLRNDRVAVPARCWKVIVAVEGDGHDDPAARVTASTRVIAVVMPNDQSVAAGWGQYRTTVREVEALTGYTFFDRVPREVAEALKGRADAETLPPPRGPRTGD